MDGGYRGESYLNRYAHILPNHTLSPRPEGATPIHEYSNPQPYIPAMRTLKTIYPILPTPSQAPTGRLLHSAWSSRYKSSLYKGGASKRSLPLEYSIVYEPCLKTSNPLLFPIGFHTLTSKSTYPSMTVVGPTGNGAERQVEPPPHIGPRLHGHPFKLFTPSPLSNPFSLPVVLQSPNKRGRALSEAPH